MARDAVYLQLADALEARITSDPRFVDVPSENELAREHDVSRLTARAALEELERRYLVRRSRGRRAVIARRIPYRIGPHRSASWSANVSEGGAEPRSLTVSLRLRRAPAAVRATLGLDGEAKTLHLTRRRFADDELAAYAETWLVAARVPELDRYLGDDASLEAVLARVYRLRPRRSWLRASYEVMPAPVAQALELESRAVALRLEGLTVGGDGAPIETTVAWLRADIFDVIFEMGDAK